VQHSITSHFHFVVMQLGECKSELLADGSTCAIAANNVISGSQVSGKLSLCSIEGVRGGCCPAAPLCNSWSSRLAPSQSQPSVTAASAACKLSW
jgi:hypothetical protein